MKTRSTLRILASLLSVAMVLALSGRVAAATEDRISKSFAVEPGGQLTIRADRGSIDVVTTDASKVDVEVVRKAKDEEVLKNHEVTFNPTGKDVEVVAKYKGKTDGFLRGLWNNLQVQYKVTVPRNYSVDLKTAGGGITVADIAGKVRVETSGGALRLGQVTGPVWGHTSGGSIKVAAATEAAELRTSGGSIDAGDIGGTLLAETSGGSISVKSAKGEATAHTSGGNIHIESAAGPLNTHTSGGSISIGKASGATTAETSGGGISLEDVTGTVQAGTSGGSITARFGASPKGDCTLKTSGGGIRVHLSSDVAVTVDAQSSGGRVNTDLPVTVQGQQKSGHLQGKINGGGPTLLLRTSGGGIHLNKL